MAAGHEEPEASFTIFIKPVERLGRIYKNCKANTRIGWIFSFVNNTSEYTLKNLGKAQSLHYITIGNAYSLG